MRRYTVILEFAGGTYLAQVEAATVEEAAQTWVRQLEWSAVEGMDAESFRELERELESEEATPIDNLVDVWCLAALPHDQLCLIHVVGS